MIEKSNRNVKFIEDKIWDDYVGIDILDWLGLYNSGVTILLNFRIKEKNYDILYWIKPNGDFRLVIDDIFLTDYQISNIYKYKHFKDLKNYIDLKVLPEKEEIWKEYGLI